MSSFLGALSQREKSISCVREFIKSNVSETAEDPSPLPFQPWKRFGRWRMGGGELCMHVVRRTLIAWREATANCDNSDGVWSGAISDKVAAGCLPTATRTARKVNKNKVGTIKTEGVRLQWASQHPAAAFVSYPNLRQTVRCCAVQAIECTLRKQTCSKMDDNVEHCSPGA